jgi:hypothetical protein
MRRYDDPVEVRRGMVGGTEGPEQFLWHGRLWKVRAVLAHWSETGAWWESAGARAALGTAEESSEAEGGLLTADLTAEQEVWRVEASRGRLAAEGGGGVFDLVFDWSAGSWRLARCAD